MNNTILTRIKGYKKISAALIALIAAILGPELAQLDPAVIGNITSVLSFYLVGQGIADAGENYKK